MDNVAPDAVLRPQDQRSHPRVPLELPGVVIIANRQQEPLACLVTDLSAGGAGVNYPQAAPGTELLARLCITNFGEFEGITTGRLGEIQGFRFLSGEAEKQNLESKLTALIEDGLGSAPDRGNAPAGERTYLSFSRTNGDTEQCEVLAISMRGVVLSTHFRPPLGELVRLGRVYGRVFKYFRSGILLEFVSMVQRSDAAG